MKRRDVLRSALLALALVGASGCSWLGRAGGCEAYFRSYPVSDLGGAEGIGKIALAEAQGQPGVVHLELALFDPAQGPSSAPAMQLDGVGSCENATAKIRFGAKGESEQFRVLGGSAVALFDPEVTDQPFGRWEMLVFDKSQQKELTLSGFWQANDDATHPLADSQSADVAAQQGS
jgi:hypothetical protein